MFGWLRRSKLQTASPTPREPTISRANSEAAKTVMFFVLAMMQWVDDPEHRVEMDALGWHLLCTSMSDRVAQQRAGLDVTEIAISAASGLFSAEPDEVSDAAARMKENWARLEIQHPQLSTRYKARVHALITDPAACAVVHLAGFAAKPDELKQLFQAIPPPYWRA